MQLSWFDPLRPNDAYITIIGTDDGLSPGRRQAIIWTNAGILLTGPLGTNFNEILIGIHTFSFKKSIWKCRLENDVHFVSDSMCLTHSPNPFLNALCSASQSKNSGIKGA